MVNRSPDFVSEKSYKCPSQPSPTCKKAWKEVFDFLEAKLISRLRLAQSFCPQNNEQCNFCRRNREALEAVEDVKQDDTESDSELGSEAEDEEEGFRDILKFLPSAPAWQQPIAGYFHQ
jgi:hypothetical protein